MSAKTCQPQNWIPACQTLHVTSPVCHMNKLGTNMQQLVWNIVLEDNSLFYYYCKNSMSNLYYSQWANVFAPCEQFLRRLWTMTGCQVKGGGGVVGAIGAGTSGEGRLHIIYLYSCISDTHVFLRSWVKFGCCCGHQWLYFKIRLATSCQ